VRPRLKTVARMSKPAKVAIKRAIGSLTSVTTQEPVAALTFDDGPHPEYTPRVAAVLKRYDARATFFMVGQAAEKRPDLVRAIGQAGHAIGVHSWEHSSFRLMTGRERRRQIRACARVLAPYAQRLVRPPYGEQSVAARLDALWLGYEVVSWNVDVGDWFEPDASLMSSRLVASIRPGSMVLLHDALFDHGAPHRGPKLERTPHVNRESMLEALERALAHLHGKFRFVTVPELMQYGTPHRVLWFKKAEY
jgi:peptidoglycan/xylan/chitin deacetylase (PgdA/CDA1 family)